MQDPSNRPSTVDQVRELLDGERASEPPVRTRAAAYRLVEQTLRRLDYCSLRKTEKGVVRRFLARGTGLSRAQIDRLLHQYRATGQLRDHRGAPRRPFPRRYTDTDIELLAAVDVLHATPAVPVALKLHARAYHLFGDLRFERLAGISGGHLYNLRRSPVYRSYRAAKITPTRPVLTAVTRGHWKPQPFEQPGHLRVVSLRPKVGLEGLHCLAFVDEVTQFRFVSTVDRLDKGGLRQALGGLPRAFPFTVRGFHAGVKPDPVASHIVDLLQPWCEDRIGRSPTRGADAQAADRNSPAARLNAFTRRLLSPFLNYHWLYLFPTEPARNADRAAAQPAGAIDIMTPYERLKSLRRADHYLSPGISFAQLDAVALAMTDHQAARMLTNACLRLFGSINPPAAASIA